MGVGASGTRRRGCVSRLLCFSAAGWLAGCASAGASPPATVDSRTEEPALATFTAAQADLGERVFGSICSVCHGRNEFRGPIFSLTWRVEPVGHLFEHISTTMPQDDPGSLTAEQYAAIVAYMLRLNGRQPGDIELPAEAERLNELRW